MLVKTEKAKKMGNSTVIIVPSEFEGKELYIFDREAYSELVIGYAKDKLRELLK